MPDQDYTQHLLDMYMGLYVVGRSWTRGALLRRRTHGEKCPRPGYSGAPPTAPRSRARGPSVNVGPRRWVRIAYT
jgi:hypothetical protein